MFKPGDKVKIIDPDWNTKIPAGTEGTIIGPSTSMSDGHRKPEHAQYIWNVDVPGYNKGSNPPSRLMYTRRMEKVSPEFSKGDIVRLNTDRANLAATKGALARVARDYNGQWLNIKWISGPHGGQVDGNYHPQHFDKVERKPGEYFPGDHVRFTNNGWKTTVGATAVVLDPPTQPAVIANATVLRIEWTNNVGKAIKGEQSFGWYDTSFQLIDDLTDLEVIALEEEAIVHPYPENDETFHCMKLYDSGVGFDKVGDIITTQSKIRQHLADNHGAGTYFVKVKNEETGFIFTASEGGWTFTDGLPKYGGLNP